MAKKKQEQRTPTFWERLDLKGRIYGLDRFPEPIQLNFNKQASFPTIPGVIVTLILLLLVLFSTCQMLKFCFKGHRADLWNPEVQQTYLPTTADHHSRDCPELLHQQGRDQPQPGGLQDRLRCHGLLQERETLGPRLCAFPGLPRGAQGPPSCRHHSLGLSSMHVSRL